MKKPLFIIAGTNSGCGKTTVTLGILHSLLKKKLNPAAFKAGPDYIDPSYHKSLTGKPGCNLDSWMMTEETIRHLVNKNLEQADVGVIEGVMGLYDGISGDEYPKGSSAHIAEILQIPVILVVNAKGLAHSIVPLVNGFKTHGKRQGAATQRACPELVEGSYRSGERTEKTPHIEFLGVILNHVGSNNHYEILKQLIEYDCNLPCFGFIKKLSFTLPERHLGLVPFQELDDSNLKLDEVTENIDIDLILNRLSRNQIGLPPWQETQKFSAIKNANIIDKTLKKATKQRQGSQPNGLPPGTLTKSFSKDKFLPNDSIKQPGPQQYRASALVNKKTYKLTIAVAKDKVFSFYYEDNLDVLKEQGAQLKYFSPIHDRSLPDNINGIYFGGGFPEIFARELYSNKEIMKDVRKKFAGDLPIYAECGGLIYLFETLIDHDNNKHKMAGLIKGTIKMEQKKQALGYYEAKLNGADLPLLRGHQFHYSRVVSMDDPDVLPLYQIKKPAEKKWKPEGFKKGNLMASYLHLHFRDQMEFVHYFLEKCKG